MSLATIRERMSVSSCRVASETESRVLQAMLDELDQDIAGLQAILKRKQVVRQETAKRLRNLS